ncbi:MAG: lipid-A-disaccharide synthase [Bacteroidales bacterium]|nr:lipid-A-disaccharide synthase [Bacteroidales bacterium]
MKFYLIAGEASGDLHGSNLIKGLRAEDPDAQFRFWGGQMMLEASDGGTLVKDYKEGAVMGVSDVLAKAGKLLGNIKECKRDILGWEPDVVILIDYPGFNMKIARFCHEKGIKVFYYIAPKTWASRDGRNRKLKAWVDRLYIVFPFEIPYFTRKGIPFTYKGNPLVDAVDGHSYERVIDKAGYVALLAGSRKGEISRMMPVCMQVADRLAERGLRVVIAGAPSRTENDYLPWIGERKNVDLVFGRTYDVLKFADAAIINSGTASLEAALIGTPQVVCWSTSALTAFVADKILHVLEHIKYVSLGNLCIDKPAFKELLQQDFTTDKVCDELYRLLDDEAYRKTMLEDYDSIRRTLGGCGASRAIARAMIDELLAGSEN